MLKYDIRTGVKKIKTKTALAISGATLGFAGLIAAIAIPLGAHASGTAIYNNIPNTVPGNVPSVSFEATGTSEFGGQVSFAGTARTNPTVTVLMSSWGCQNGHWTSGDCLTTPGATFSEPITLNVYNVGSGNSVGSLVTSVTQPFQIPYRPSASPSCTGAQLGEWFSVADNTCYNGFATPISFALTGVTLPENAIVSVAYNTSDYGSQPYGRTTACSVTPAGCGYDSLNVGTANALTVGTQPTPNDAYQLTLHDACPSQSGPITPFGIDTGCWGGFQPAFKVEVNLPSKDDCKNNGWKTMVDATNHHFKNQGDCVSYFATSGRNGAAGAMAAHTAIGNVTLSNPTQTLSFNTQDNGVSSSDTGTVTYTNPGASVAYTVPITCTNISGSTAYFAYDATSSVGVWVIWKVVDGSPDAAGFTTANNKTDANALCETGFVPSVYNFTPTSGDIVVQ